MANEVTTEKKTYSEDERIIVLKNVANSINEANLPGITAKESDYVIAKGKYKGTKSILTWVSLEGQRILGYKFTKSGFLNLSYVLEGTSEETMQEVGTIAASVVGLQKPIMPDDYTNFETELKTPTRTGPRIDIAALQAKLSRW